jgi:gamma-glutamylcyclotransferase (GGCT)/AIG2-like uncharacterized protein YtfP
LPGNWRPYLEPASENATASDWAPVYGELLTFDDPESRLPAIDRLEGFLPDGPSLYRRVLVRLANSSVVSLSVAWGYVLGVDIEREQCRRLPGIWRPRLG